MAVMKEVAKDTKPWWKYGYVWLVISGPAVVVVAGFYTLWLAISSPNVILTNDNYRQAVEINKALEDQQKILTPALKGRNHAATPLVEPVNN